MKGYLVTLATLLNLVIQSQAIADEVPHGRIQFHGSVIDGYCTLKTHDRWVQESCPIRTAISNVSVSQVNPTGTAQTIQALGIHLAKNTVRRMPPVSNSYALETASGAPVTQGRYLITLTVL
ncbi:hypothetical protein [Pseudomonas coleopterorum]|uniref:hypothetical protein n=1 Tax=Pseudomonas coleopterorum TaxID=1605838 RepID=UPI00073BCD23|nr:hypothetical protein [Pseudomonas coleopterorum]KTC40449.1 hypothetical protein AO269_24150 [Pseudomonas putida]MBD8482749.1 hypothetical protein [Pseudomonas coleopterorum]